MTIICPKCGGSFCIEVTKVARLEREVKDLHAKVAALETKLRDAQGMANLRDIFGGFK